MTTIVDRDADLLDIIGSQNSELLGPAGVRAAIGQLPAATVRSILATFIRPRDQPLLCPTPFLLGARALEDAGTRGMVHSAAMALAPDAAQSINDDADRAVALLERRGLLDEPEALFTPPPVPTQVHRTRRRWQGINFGHTSFPSAYEPVKGLPRSKEYLADDANRTVHMYVLRHDDKPRPYLVMLHPYQTGEASDLVLFGSLAYFFGLGVNVIHPVLPFHGPRGVSGTRRYPTVDALTNFHACVQAISDVRSVLHLLRQRNATAIAVHGYSLGGFTAATLAGIDPDLDCVVAGAAPMDLMPRQLIDADADTHTATTRLLTDGAPAELRRLVSPLTYTPHLDRDRRFIYACAGEQLIDPRAPIALRAHWDDCRFQWLQATHMTGMTSPAAHRFIWSALRSTVAPLR